MGAWCNRVIKLRRGVSCVEGLYASKLPTLLQHAFLVAQAVVAQSIPPERRAAALGRLMMMYTIGATVGPALGGYLGAKGGGADVRVPFSRDTHPPCIGCVFHSLIRPRDLTRGARDTDMSEGYKPAHARGLVFSTPS